MVLFEGKALLSSFISGERFPLDEATRIRIGQKITTGPNTIIEIALDDGTMLSIRESTSISFYYLRKEKTNPPTKLKLDFGKIRIKQKKNFTDKTLEIITPASEISVVMADFSLISVDNYALVLVHRGRVGLASTNPKVREAYVGTNGEEILVPRDGPPLLLGKVAWTGRERWLSGYLVVDRYRRIVRKSDGGEVIDRIDHIGKEALW